MGEEAPVGMLPGVDYVFDSSNTFACGEMVVIERR